MRMLSGFSQGFILGPIIRNFTLAYFTDDFFADSIFKDLKRNIGSTRVTRFFLSYADDFMIKVISQDEVIYALKKLKSKLSGAGLEIDDEQHRIYDFSTRVKFDWLGYTFLALPKKILRYTRLVSRKGRLTRRHHKSDQTVLLLYITNSNFTSIKKKLKKEIKKLKHGHLFPVLRKVNSMLKDICVYYGFAVMEHRLNYLRHFVDRVF